MKNVRFLLILMSFGAQLLPGAQAALPSFAEVKKRDQASDLTLLDRNQKKIETVRVNSNLRKEPWVSLDQISKVAQSILVKVEDQRFWEHTGVDWIALAQSSMKWMTRSQTRGASTLSMQLVSLIEPSEKPNGKRNVSQKISQIDAALALEKSWTKSQILEAYLNLVPLRGDKVGIPAAARFLLHKSVNSLDTVDALLLVAMLPSPNQAYSDLVTRACAFAKNLYPETPDLQKRYCQEVSQLAQKLSASASVDFLPSVNAPYLQNFLKNRKGSSVQTSLDLGLQEKIVELTRGVLRSLKDQNVDEAAILVLDNQSGEILSYVGNIPEFTHSPHVDGVTARRQAGSTLKPFFYGYALDNRYVELNSTLKDEATLFQTDHGSFRPENYDHEYHGDITLPVALASSLNVPAVKIVQMIGVDHATEILKKIGVKNLRPAFAYGLSIALGTVDITLQELTEAYRTLAIRKGPFRPETYLALADILSSNDARSLTFGESNVLHTPYFTAAKTGTSKDMRDNWCIGYSERFTVGVWVGNFNGSPMHDVSGVIGAAPLWRKIMDFLNDRSPSKRPTDLAQTKVELMPTESKTSAPKEEDVKILYPKEGAILAFDPEIESDLQRVLFKSTAKSKTLTWQLNGKKIGPLSEPYLWKVERGKYSLEILAPSGKSLDRVQFVVK